MPAYFENDPLVRAAIAFVQRKLGAENVWHELFDFGHQLGFAYKNPINGKQHAERIVLHRGKHFVADLADLVRNLADHTNV